MKILADSGYFRGDGLWSQSPDVKKRENSQNVLTGAPALASVPLGLGMSCAVPSGNVDG